MNKNNSKGFTLIELLIVIVIIGILAGVLIAVINPAAQSNKARDAGVQASINKVALATEGFISAYGRAPNGAEFLGGLQNAASSGVVGGGCTAADEHCLFSVTGNPLPGTATTGCPTASWTGNGAGQCYFRYERIGGAAGTAFQVYGKSFGIANTVFRYLNTDAQMKSCTADATPVCP